MAILILGDTPLTSIAFHQGEFSQYLREQIEKEYSQGSWGVGFSTQLEWIEITHVQRYKNIHLGELKNNISVTTSVTTRQPPLQAGLFFFKMKSGKKEITLNIIDQECAILWAGGLDHHPSLLHWFDTPDPGPQELTKTPEVVLPGAWPSAVTT